MEEVEIKKKKKFAPVDLSNMPGFTEYPQVGEDSSLVESSPVSSVKSREKVAASPVPTVLDDTPFSFHAFLNLPPYVYLALKRRSLSEKKRMTAIVRELVIREFSGGK